MNTFEVQGDNLVETDTPAVVLARKRTRWIVRRGRFDDYGNATEAWTGPMNTFERAERERDAWLDCGRPAEVVEYTPEIALRVLRWSNGMERLPFDAVSS